MVTHIINDRVPNEQSFIWINLFGVFHEHDFLLKKMAEYFNLAI